MAFSEDAAIAGRGATRPGIHARAVRLGNGQGRPAPGLYASRANWKLALENYHECYHCVPAHPEFARLHALARPNNRALSDAPDPKSGLVDFERWDADPGAGEVVRVMRSHLLPGFETGSRDTRRVAPPMGEGGRREDGLVVFGELGFLTAFLAYPDHGVIYRFVPVSPLRPGWR